MTAPTTIDGAMMTDDRMKPGHCHKCGLPLTDNPHPEAGKPPHYLQVGCPKECIPCLTLSRHQWAGRAMKAESELADARAMLAASPATPAQSGEPRGTLAGYFLNCAADDVKPHYLPVGDEHKDNEDVVALYFAPHAPGCGDGEDCDACNAMNAAPPPSQPVEAGDALVTMSISVARDGSVSSDVQTHDNSYSDVAVGLSAVRDEINRVFDERKSCPHYPSNTSEALRRVVRNRGENSPPAQMVHAMVPSAVVLDGERAAFEADYAKVWNADMKESGWNADHTPDDVKDLREGDTYGEGRDYLNARWEGWQARATSPQATATQPAQTRALTDERIAKQFLLESDSAALFVFNGQCEDFEADGYTASAETMERLSELGVVRRLSSRGKRYGVTAFGSWLIEAEFAQNPGLPLRTISEHNERETRGHAMYLKESAPHGTAWVELPRGERESWRRKATTAAQPASGADHD